MSRIVLYIGLLFLWALPVLANPPRPLAHAIDAARGGAWETAARLAEREGDVAADIIEWMRLRAGRGTLTELSAFLERRPGWPSEAFLRRRSEPSVIAAGTEAAQAFFETYAPQTAMGVLQHAAALKAAGRADQAGVALVLAWREMPMTATDQALYLAEHSELLAPHHAARFHEMLWRGAENNAQRMASLVGDDLAALGAARIALQNTAGDVDTKIKAVPAALQTDPGLVHDRFQWRMRKGRWNEAKVMLLDASRSLKRLGQPQAWANNRRVLARDEMRDGEPATAYQIAARHYLTGGAAYADLEWLSGYIALRYLEDPDIALEHFRNHDKAVRSPISKGRAGYWMGRALEAMDQPELAAEAYTAGAAYQTSFYGLLAAERAGLPPDPDLDGSEAFGDWRASALAARPLFQAGRLLLEIGERTMAERFWTQLAGQIPRAEIGQLGQAAIDLDQPHIAVMIGKRAAQRGIVVHGAYYALHPLAEAALPMAPEMSLAIARRESEFDPSVQSGVGARGLMQVMPATGREVAARLGVENHSTERMTSDPEYNARLGATYLATLAARFDGNPVMMAAGYNAGPSRPARWMERFGDPRSNPEFDMIDWIEHIPFRETRNYVMRVTESLPIYRARLGGDALPVPFGAELTGSGFAAFARNGE